MNLFPRSSSLAVVVALLASLIIGCAPGARITEGTVIRPYPYEAPILRVEDVQVFRDGTHIELVNHSTQSFTDFDLWINERFVRRIESLPAGDSLRLSLWEFVDEHGNAFRAGGLFATERADPVIKAEVESDQGLVGWVVIPEERG